MESPTCYAGNFWSSMMSANLDSLVPKLLLKQAENHSLIYEIISSCFKFTLARHFSFSEVSNAGWVTNQYKAAAHFLGKNQIIFRCREHIVLMWEHHFPVLQPHFIICMCCSQRSSGGLYPNYPGSILQDNVWHCTTPQPHPTFQGKNLES